MRATDGVGASVGRITFKEVDESTAETTDIKSFVERQGVGLAMVLGLTREYEVVRESPGINTKEGQDFVTRLREKGVPYHLWTCRDLINCSCFVRS